MSLQFALHFAPRPHTPPLSLQPVDSTFAGPEAAGNDGWPRSDRQARRHAVRCAAGATRLTVRSRVRKSSARLLGADAQSTHSRVLRAPNLNGPDGARAAGSDAGAFSLRFIGLLESSLGQEHVQPSGMRRLGSRQRGAQAVPPDDGHLCVTSCYRCAFAAVLSARESGLDSGRCRAHVAAAGSALRAATRADYLCAATDKPEANCRRR